jgi:hypothetical protein
MAINRIFLAVDEQVQSQIADTAAAMAMTQFLVAIPALVRYGCGALVVVGVAMAIELFRQSGASNLT